MCSHKPSGDVQARHARVITATCWRVRWRRYERSRRCGSESLPTAKKKVMEGLLMRIGRCSTLYGQSRPSRALQSCHTELGGWLWVGEWNYDIRGWLTVKRSSHVTQWKVKKLVERIACKKQVKDLSKSNEKYHTMQIWLTCETL